MFIQEFRFLFRCLGFDSNILKFLVVVDICWMSSDINIISSLFSLIAFRYFITIIVDVEWVKNDDVTDNNNRSSSSIGLKDDFSHHESQYE